MSNPKGQKLFSFTDPVEGEIISGVQSNDLLKQAFDFSPGTVLKFSYTDQHGIAQTEGWEAFTDAYNYCYLYCSTTKSSAYYVNDGNMLYFTTFYGSKDSLLYYFYLTAFKVLLGHYENLEISDQLPLNTLPNQYGMIWIHDFIAPFINNRVKANYSMSQTGSDDPYHPKSLTLTSKIDLSVFGKTRNESNGTILLNNNRIEKFTFSRNKIKIEATCVSI